MLNGAKPPLHLCWLTAEYLCCLQLISARLQYFLQGVFISLPTASSQALNITVRLYDTASNLVNTSAGIQVQVGMLGASGQQFMVFVRSAFATKQSACSQPGLVLGVTITV